MWRTPPPANSFGPGRAAILGALWDASVSFAHLLVGVFYVVAFVAALILSLSAIAAGQALELTPPLQGWLDAFVLMAAACYFMESWLRGHNNQKAVAMIASLRARISAGEDALPAKVRRVVQDMRHRGELG